MKKNDVLPFGLLFEESVVPTLDTVAPVYDESEGISVIIDENGNKTPYVEWNGSLGTKTETRIKGENSDDDESPKTLGTRTETFVTEEVSDADDMANQYLGTKTATAVKSEQTDDDPTESLHCFPLFGTKTATKSSGEGTDDDE